MALLPRSRVFAAALLGAAWLASGCVTNFDVARLPEYPPDADGAVDEGAPDGAADDAPNDAVACGVGRTQCGPRCVDTRTDLMHCGECDAACARRANTTVECAAGRCSYACAPGFGDCDMVPENGCEAPLTDIANCGRCGNRCPSMMPFCTTTNGASACASGCAAPMVMCASACVDTRTNRSHCGACGRVCGAQNTTSSTCEAGACVYPCRAGFGDCDGNPANGCEVDTRTEFDHCGRCGERCFPGSICTEGVCRCDAPRGICNRRCVELLGDPNNCGMCEVRCDTLRPRCVNGICVP